MTWSLSNTEAISPKDYRIKVPTVLQMEAVECGAASLAMILAHYGKFIPLEQLRLDCGVSRDGSKASNILKAARQHGLVAKGFRMEPKDLRGKKGPFIIHWNFNHFLVLEGFRKEKVYLNDPGYGSRVVSWEEFDQSFTGVVLTFEKSPDFVLGGSKPNIIGALAKRIKGAESALGYIVLTGLMLVIPGLIIPAFTKVFVDQILVAGKATWLTALLIGMGITAVFRGLLTWLQEYYLLRLESKISVSSSSRFLWHVLRLPVVFFTQRFAGDISSRVSSNDRVAQLLSRELAKTALGCVMIVFYFILMLQYDLFLTLVGVAAVALNLAALQTISRKRVDLNMRLLVNKGKLMGTSMAGLQTIETLKATGSESDFFAKWSGYQAKVVNAEQEMSQSTQYLMALPQFLTMATNTLILVLGCYRVLDGALTMGMLVAFQSLMSSFMAPVTDIVGLGSTLHEVEGDMNRLDDVVKYPLDTYVTQTQADGYDGLPKLSGNVEIRNLCFGYSPLEPPLIENFCLQLRPGSRVALVGGSGSGKSTVAKLVAGLYQPWSGEILFDGMDRTKIPRSVINNSLAVVDQDIAIFAGSIKDNLTLWDDTVSEQDIIRATKDACIHDDIAERDGGYEHIVLEGGANFSGGQRQRLEIARALVNNPTILVMDEATSALDPKTEQIVDERIRQRGCTCLIVAHRLSTIRDCDEIIVMDKGKIVQRGTHDDMKNDPDGLYAKLIQAS